MHLLYMTLPRSVLAAATLALVAGCGGSDDPPPNPNPNDALASAQITAAQAAVEPTATAIEAGSTVLSAAQIDTQQRTAVDRATIVDTAGIGEKQAALDGGENLVPTL